MSVYRLEPNDNGETYKRGRNDTDYLHGWKILETKTVSSDEMLRRVRQILSDKENYGEMAPDCFWPEIGFRFGDSNLSPAAVICLKCEQLYVFEGDEREHRTLSKQGVSQLLDVFNDLFSNN